MEGPTLREGTARFPLEIDENGVVPAHQDLPEMEIPVMARFPSGTGQAGKGPRLGHERGRRGEHLAGRSLPPGGKTGEPPLQAGHGFPDLPFAGAGPGS